LRISPGIVLRSRAFWVTIGLSALANLWTLLTHPQCCDQFDRIGFPFPFHLSGGFAGVSTFYPLGLALNLLVTLTLALIAARVALAFKRQD